MTYEWGCTNNFKLCSKEQITLARNHLKALSLPEDVLKFYWFQRLQVITYLKRVDLTPRFRKPFIRMNRS